MSNSNGRFLAALLRRIASLVACLAISCVVAGCGGSQVDKYTVTEADRKGAAPVIGADGKPIAPIPRDSHDTAAYGPDGKPMAR